jgi:hypothetical protein
VHGEDPSPQIYVYFNVSDIEAAAARVRSAGGEAEEPTDEPGFGRFVNCRDPGGIRFGLHQTPGQVRHCALVHPPAPRVSE